MADDEENPTNNDEEEEEEEPSLFSKIPGFSNDKDKDEEGDTKTKEGGKSGIALPVFDPEAWGTFGMNVLVGFVELVLVSIICVNIMFFVHPQSIRMNNINIQKLFPTDRHNWPYCYTNEYTDCDAKCADKFGGIADDPKNSSVKKIYLKAAIILDTFIFKWFCLTKHDVETMRESVDDGVTSVNLLNWDFMIIRFKQWVNNTFIYSFSTSRSMVSYILSGMTKMMYNIPKELYDVVSPLIILFTPLIFFVILFYFIAGGPAFVTMLGMFLNKTDNRNEFIGGFLWTILTGGGIVGLLPMGVLVIQIIQYIGTFFIYPLMDMTTYRNLYAKYIPIIFFFFNIMVMFYAFENLEINTAAILIITLLSLYLISYWDGIMDFFTAIKNYGS